MIKGKFNTPLLAVGIFIFLVVVYNQPTVKKDSYLLLVPPPPPKNQSQYWALRKMLTRNVRATDVFFYTDLEQLSYTLLAGRRIRTAFLFKRFAGMFNVTQKIQSGVYQIPANLSTWKTARYLAQASPHSNMVVVSPGDSLASLRAKFESAKTGRDIGGKEKNLTTYHSNYSNLTSNYSDWEKALATIKNYYGMETTSPAGFIYPGLYFLTPETEWDDLLTASVKAFDREFGAYLKEAGDPSTVLKRVLLPQEGSNYSSPETNWTPAVLSLEALTSRL